MADWDKSASHTDDMEDGVPSVKLRMWYCSPGENVYWTVLLVILQIALKSIILFQ